MYWSCIDVIVVRVKVSRGIKRGNVQKIFTNYYYIVGEAKRKTNSLFSFNLEVAAPNTKVVVCDDTVVR